MIIIEHKQEDFFGAHLDYKTYWSTIPSSHLLCFLPGITELGVGDGTQEWELDKFGFPRLAENGFDFPFNIIACQPSGSYSGFSKFALPWLQMEFKPSKIILIGISLGAIACCDLLTKDKYGLISAVVSLSGKASDITAAPRMVSVPGYAWHGDADTTVKFSTAMAFYNAYNQYNTDNNLPGHFTIKVIPGGGHGGWDQAMSITPGQDDIYQFILKQFGSEPVSGLTYQDGKDFIKNAAIQSIQAL